MLRLFTCRSGRAACGPVYGADDSFRHIRSANRWARHAGYHWCLHELCGSRRFRAPSDMTPPCCLDTNQSSPELETARFGRVCAQFVNFVFDGIGCATNAARGSKRFSIALPIRSAGNAATAHWLNNSNFLVGCRWALPTGWCRHAWFGHAESHAPDGRCQLGVDFLANSAAGAGCRPSVGMRAGQTESHLRAGWKPVAR